MNELALFAGAGGGILGGYLLGWTTVCAVERDAYAAQVLAQRQNDGILKPFPVWSDVTTFDGKPWRGIVDVISGGFPCQDISIVGKGAGIEGERSGLWSEFARIIGEIRPSYVYIENSPMRTVRGLDSVVCELTKMGYDAEWGCVSASDCGACHSRERIWIVAHADSIRLQGGAISGGGGKSRAWPNEQLPRLLSANTWLGKAKAGEYGSSDGLANWVDRTKAIGNGQFPLVAKAAFNILSR